MLVARPRRLGSSVALDRLRARAAVIPTDAPESDGTLEWRSTTIVVVEAAGGGETGLGYTYADGSAAGLIQTLLAPVVEGRDIMDLPACSLSLERAIRNQGSRGLAMMAVSAVDGALWDLKAKVLGLPIVKLLGAARSRAAAYGSGGFTSYSVERLAEQLSGWIAQGFSRVKMKVGREPRNDPGRVRAARRAIGPDAQLFVDANGAYGRKQAIALAGAFMDQEVAWFEEPVTQDDVDGLAFVRARLPPAVELAAGEYCSTAFDFKDLLDAGAVDVLQADMTRCGGLSGFLKAAALCETHGVPLSTHTAPSLHATAACVAPAVRHVEYFHDHARIEELLFDGAPRPVAGYVAPELSRPGFGLALKRGEARRHGLEF